MRRFQSLLDLNNHPLTDYILEKEKSLVQKEDTTLETQIMYHAERFKLFML
jgi:hypothetical protein